MFAKRGFENSIVHIGDSVAHERSWFIIHSDRGGIVLGLWYRRPARDETESITSLYEEFASFSEGTFRTIIMGDMNVHEVEWLKFSNRNSLEGRELQTFSKIPGLSERADKPTRGDNLLDLVLNDLGTELTCEV